MSEIKTVAALCVADLGRAVESLNGYRGVLYSLRQEFEWVEVVLEQPGDEPGSIRTLVPLDMPVRLADQTRMVSWREAMDFARSVPNIVEEES